MNHAAQNRTLIEVCVGSLADADAALTAGADRLELCGALELGGLTPSIGLVRVAVDRSIAPVLAMVRPRAGGFCYSDSEFSTALTDAEALLAAGARGVVFGFLTPSGEVDSERCRELVRLAGDRETVFHRAIDFTPDLTMAAQGLADIGVTRVLTSGGAFDSLAGAGQIRAMRTAVGDTLQVIPGGGVTPANVIRVLRETGCDQVHVGASIALNDGSLMAQRGVSLNDSRCADGVHYRAIDYDLLQRIVAETRTRD